ncbi:MAG: RNA polymerase sigma-70 factor (ECF subfamily) [Myxococcota bacterium]|jgi:RNA polymerase sigma-70 factor (ECF subfamily)
MKPARQSTSRHVLSPETLQAASVGEPDAWRALLDAHGPVVYALCRRLDPDPDDAYQEIWEKVLHGLHRFDPSGSAPLASWILRVAHRHLIDRHRRRRVRGEVVELGELPGAPVLLESRLDRAQQSRRLESALTRLPIGQRRVVVMHHIEGHSLEDIAKTEGVAVGTVKSRLHRGRGRLAVLMGRPT